LEEARINRNDVVSLPSYFLEKTPKHFKSDTIEKLWPTEAELLPSLLEDGQPLNDNPPVVSFHVRSDFDVFPNCGEDSGWWRLGNLREDGVNTIIDTFLKHDNLGLKLNYEIPLKYLAAKYGNRKGERLYSKTSLGQRWIRLEAMGSSVKSPL
jgi:hypothetical protein